MGALEALNAGVTTLLDFSHCIATPEHADAGLQGLRDAGARAIYAYGYLATFTDTGAFENHRQRLADARRLRLELSSDDALVTMGVALSELGLIPFADTVEEVRSAHEMAVPQVLHSGCTWGTPVTQGIPELDYHGLLGPDQIHVHCNTLDTHDLTRLAAHDCKVSSSPETELQMGMGHPVVGRALTHGMRPSLSCDVVSASSGDMFRQMQLALQFERCMRNDRINAQHEMPDRLELTVRDALRWGTANGAHALGIEARTGSITVGKQADVIVVGGPGPNITPMTDPVGCLLSHAGPADVRHVLVDGRIRKRDGQLCDVDLARVAASAAEAGQRVLGAIADQRLTLPPPLPPGLADAMRTLAARHLAQAYVLERA